MNYKAWFKVDNKKKKKALEFSIDTSDLNKASSMACYIYGKHFVNNFECAFEVYKIEVLK